MPDPLFYLWLGKALTNEKRCYICNVISHWLRPWWAMGRKRALVQSLIVEELVVTFAIVTVHCPALALAKGRRAQVNCGNCQVGIIIHIRFSEALHRNVLWGAHLLSGKQYNAWFARRPSRLVHYASMGYLSWVHDKGSIWGLEPRPSVALVGHCQLQGLARCNFHMFRRKQNLWKFVWSTRLSTWIIIILFVCIV